MKAKDIVTKIYPDARIESHTTRFPKERYYLVRRRGAYMYMAEGATESKAWEEALGKVLHDAKIALNPEKSIID